MKTTILEELRIAVAQGNAEKAEEGAKKALESGIPPLQAISDGLAKGVREIGSKFAEGEVYLVELIVSGKAMKAGMAVLLPAIKAQSAEIEKAGTVVIGTVEGDIHSIGKDIVATLLEANGFEVINAGEDVPASVFLDTAKREKADIIGLSALLTSSMPRQRDVIEEVRKSGQDIKVMIGGAPTTKDWADEIGADGWAGDAVTAAKTAKELMAKKRTSTS